jgi:hypothetical protein
MTLHRSLVASVLFSLLLGACAWRGQTPVATSISNHHDDALPSEQLAHYQAQLDALSDAEVNAALAATPSAGALANPARRMERVLLLGRRHGLDDLAQALNLLDALLLEPDAAARPWQNIARLLEHSYRADYQEQKRLLDQLDQQTQQLRDSQHRIEQLSDKVEQLSHKLDALKSIELSLPNPTGNNAPATTPSSRGAP